MSNSTIHRPPILLKASHVKVHESSSKGEILLFFGSPALRLAALCSTLCGICRWTADVGEDVAIHQRETRAIRSTQPGRWARGGDRRDDGRLGSMVARMRVDGVRWRDMSCRVMWCGVVCRGSSCEVGRTVNPTRCRFPSPAPDLVPVPDPSARVCCTWYQCRSFCRRSYRILDLVHA